MVSDLSFHQLKDVFLLNTLTPLPKCKRNGKQDKKTIIIISQFRYAFKCHRQKQDGKEEIYPVNAIAFHQKVSIRFFKILLEIFQNIVN